MSPGREAGRFFVKTHSKTERGIFMIWFDERRLSSKIDDNL